MKSFPKKRILIFYTDMLTFLVTYILLDIIISPTDITLMALIKSVTFGGTLITNGWYLQVALVLYVAFYLIFKFIKTDNAKLIAIFVFCIGFTAIMAACNMSSVWYHSLFTFPFGVLAVFKEDTIARYENKNKRALALVSFMLFCGFIILSVKIPSKSVATFLEMITAICFAIFVVTLLRFVRVNYTVTRFLGSISLEIYALQGLLLWILRTDVVDGLQGTYKALIAAAIFAATIILAWLVHPIIKAFNSKLAKQFDK